MRNKIPFLAFIVVAAALAGGCASAERKMGRGMTNLMEPTRMGELRRSVEQTALFEGPDAGYATGVIKGLNRTLVRTGVGLYEIVTAPFPPYDPVLTHYISPSPVYPDNYKPGLLSDATFATDTNLGYSGGDVFPFSPGSRFRIFDTH